MARVCLYYRRKPESDRWVPGDRFIRPLARRIIRGKPRPSGLDKVLYNLCLGLDRLGANYAVNVPFKELKQDDQVAVLGRGRYSLQGYSMKNPIVAGIGLMTHPSEWPTLCEEFPVVRYLQHSEWANSVYKPYFGDRCAIWPVGIDTDAWRPSRDPKDIDAILYDKVHWQRQRIESELIEPIRVQLQRRGLKVAEIRYGTYREEEFRSLVKRSRSMIFLTEHESQGIACQECMACDVPILAWDQGWYLDPNRFKWGQPPIPATSIPYFDKRCGERFVGLEDFDQKLSVFWETVKASLYNPRALILEQLTLAQSAQRFISFSG